MQFLKTLFWVALALILALFARVNWTTVTLELWGGLFVDVKLPVLIFAAFLLGLLPTLIIYRARLWSLKRRLDPQAPQVRTVPPPPAPPVVEPAAPSEDPL